MKTINYQNTIIYKIVCNDLNIKDIYVGHTTDFIRRKSQHKHSCNTVIDKGYNFKLYKFIRDNGGWDNFDMIEIEKYPCNAGNEARAKERYYYELLNSNLNTINPNRSKKEYYNENQKQICEKSKKWYYENNEKAKSTIKDYNIKNEEAIKEYKKEYFQINKEKLSEERMKYRNDNQENLKTYFKEHYQRNKEKISEKRKEKISCCCGSIFTKTDKNRHEKTNKHIKYLLSQS